MVGNINFGNWLWALKRCKFEKQWKLWLQRHKPVFALHLTQIPSALKVRQEVQQKVFSGPWPCKIGHKWIPPASTPLHGQLGTPRRFMYSDIPCFPLPSAWEKISWLKNVWGHERHYTTAGQLHDILSTPYTKIIMLFVLYPAQPCCRYTISNQTSSITEKTIKT